MTNVKETIELETKIRQLEESNIMLLQQIQDLEDKLVEDSYN